MPTKIDTGLVEEAFSRATTTVLENEPYRLDAVTLRKRIHEHPDHDIAVPIQHVHKWLAVLIRVDRLVHDLEARRYRLPEHSDTSEVAVNTQRHLRFPE